MPTALPTARSRNAQPIEELRLAVACLPLQTREAMLEGVLASPRIIVGAYTDREGGVCPMLAAHRRGGRTNFLSFARSWDRFTHARRRRRATRHELAVLVGLLRASLADEESESCDLARAIDEHTELLARHRRARTADPSSELSGDPTGEIVARRLRAPRWLGRRRERVSA
jgi:DNA-binding helix-hairpin-helix protein with protein kinase domain